MKRALGLLLLAGLLVAAMATAALAVVPGDGFRGFVDTGSQADDGYAMGFVDTDGDGVCDHFVDADGDGINDMRGTLGMGGHGTGDCDGTNMIDANGDGVCDNAGSGGGHGRMMGGHGSGHTTP